MQPSYLGRLLTVLLMTHQVCLTQAIRNPRYNHQILWLNASFCATYLSALHPRGLRNSTWKITKDWIKPSQRRIISSSIENLSRKCVWTPICSVKAHSTCTLDYFHSPTHWCWALVTRQMLILTHHASTISFHSLKMVFRSTVKSFRLSHWQLISKPYPKSCYQI